MIRGKKKVLSQLLMTGGLHRAVRALQSSSLTIFNFHRIRAEAGNAFKTEFDEEVFGPTAQEFRNHVRWLKGNSTILSEGELLSAIRDGRRLPDRSVMVTFDDGYVDNFTLALPILREFSVPAIFFIPTQAIEERSLGWWDLIAYAIKKCERTEIVVRGEAFALNGNRDALKVRFHQWMKLKTAEETRGLVEELAQACGVRLPSPERCGQELMTWDQVRATLDAGVAIGSHTHSHRVLATLDVATQREELKRSKTELEARLGQPVRTLAYPVGGYEHFNIETKTVARECGYEAAFSFHTGINPAHGLDPFDIRRISAPEETALYCGTLALPGLFAQRRCEASAPKLALAASS
jgi:peptidoglycan/xylan/chitin deacetylase (PgdA/CDA1 family)